MRDASIAILRKIGVETGSSNVQFAVDPKTGRMIVIEMNPASARSSAGEQGHRLPHRQDRRQARRRLRLDQSTSTASPAKPPPASDRRLITSSRRSPLGVKKNSPTPTPCSPRR
ncbi:MAG: hypothetical protein U0835_23730 [Isosphaeraceae bacterium]